MSLAWPGVLTTLTSRPSGLTALSSSGLVLLIVSIDSIATFIPHADKQLQTPELVRKLDGHQGFVKGVVFDPVGQYIASQVPLIFPLHSGSLLMTVPYQSDDNSVRIWRTDDWGLEANIVAPFSNSPKTAQARLTSVVFLAAASCSD